MSTALHQLTISEISCRNLRSADMFGKNDVYVVLELGVEKQRTTTVEGTDKVGSNPKWGNGYGESKIFDRSVRPNQRTSVRLTVWDEDPGPDPDDLIGSYVVEFPRSVEEAKRRPHFGSSAFPFSKIEGQNWRCSDWFPLTDGQDRPAGEIEPGRAELWLKAESPRRPLRRAPRRHQHDGKHAQDLPPEDFRSGHHGSPC